MAHCAENESRIVVVTVGLGRKASYRTKELITDLKILRTESGLFDELGKTFRLQQYFGTSRRQVADRSMQQRMCVVVHSTECIDQLLFVGTVLEQHPQQQLNSEVGRLTNQNKENLEG